MRSIWPRCSGTATTTASTKPTATQTTTATTATVVATTPPTHTGGGKKAKGADCATNGECASGKCAFSPFDRKAVCE